MEYLAGKYAVKTTSLCTHGILRQDHYIRMDMNSDTINIKCSCNLYLVCYMRDCVLLNDTQEIQLHKAIDKGFKQCH